MSKLEKVLNPQFEQRIIPPLFLPHPLRETLAQGQDQRGETHTALVPYVLASAYVHPSRTRRNLDQTHTLRNVNQQASGLRNSDTNEFPHIQHEDTRTRI
jgi:hypothetical protein